MLGTLSKQAGQLLITGLKIEAADSSTRVCFIRLVVEQVAFLAGSDLAARWCLLE